MDKLMVTVAIVDDHPIVRAGLRSILDTASDIHVVSEGATAAEALRLSAEFRPDVLVLDVNLPDGNGLDVARTLCAQSAHPAILILTVHRDPQTVFGLLECGAVGYVLKDDALETLTYAVRAVARGESWLSPSVASQVVHRAVGLDNSRPAAGSPAASRPAAEPVEDLHLTPAELRVLRLLAEGRDNAAIAAILVVTKRTVQNHISNLYGKLGVASRAEAMLFAFQHGLAAFPPGDVKNDER
jgi:DNA-binding NarL/FixJ family response regulator